MDIASRGRLNELLVEDLFAQRVLLEPLRARLGPMRQPRRKHRGQSACRRTQQRRKSGSGRGIHWQRLPFRRIVTSDLDDGRIYDVCFSTVSRHCSAQFGDLLYRQFALGAFRNDR